MQRKPRPMQTQPQQRMLQAMGDYAGGGQQPKADVATAAVPL